MIAAKFKETDIGKIPEDWDIVTAEDYCQKVADGTHDSPKRVKSGKPLITSRHLKEGYLDFKNAYLISDSDFIKINKRSRVDQWDVIFSMIGTVGEVYIEKSSSPAYAIKNVGIFKTDNEVEGKWLYYYFKSQYAKKHVAAAKAGTSQGYLTLAALRKFPIPKPRTPAEMISIVSVLDSIQDKIELNHKINETLGNVACTIFKSWFVNFDPVRAKAAGKPTGLPKEISGLFPSRFVDSEIGKIPLGWHALRLSEILNESNERVGTANVPEYSSTNDGLVPRTKHFTKQLAQSNEKNKVIRKGYMVFGMSRVLLNFGLMREDVGSVSGAYKVYVVNQSKINPDLLEQIMRIRADYFYKAVSSSSREGQSISSGALGLLRVVQPSEAIQRVFYEKVSGFYARAESASIESNTLVELRETLSLKLMSGEIRVS